MSYILILTQQEIKSHTQAIHYKRAGHEIGIHTQVRIPHAAIPSALPSEPAHHTFTFFFVSTCMLEFDLLLLIDFFSLGLFNN